MGQPMNENKALVYVAAIFTWGIVTIVRTAKGNVDPLINIDMKIPPKAPEAE